jgi:hypothetical protein
MTWWEELAVVVAAAACLGRLLASVMADYPREPPGVNSPKWQPRDPERFRKEAKSGW